jgi:hypothetical protein
VCVAWAGSAPVAGDRDETCLPPCASVAYKPSVIPLYRSYFEGAGVQFLAGSLSRPAGCLKRASPNASPAQELSKLVLGSLGGDRGRVDGQVGSEVEGGGREESESEREIIRKDTSIMRYGDASRPETGWTMRISL